VGSCGADSSTRSALATSLLAAGGADLLAGSAGENVETGSVERIISDRIRARWEQVLNFV
jgi:hypothetical protein